MTGGRVTIGRAADVTVLNPLLYSDLATGEVLNRIFDHLVVTDDEQRYVPGRLVRSWRPLGGGRGWEFTLHPGARWHDGTPVTAADAVFTFETALEASSGSRRRAEFLVDGEPLRFEAASPSVLRVLAPAPYASLLACLAWRPVLPRHAYSGAPLADHPRNDRPLGSGPFRFEQWIPEERLVLRRNGGHHVAAPAVEEVVWRCFSDAGGAVDALLRGEVDYVPGVPPHRLADVADAPGVEVVRSADGSVTYVALNLDDPLLADLRVREALARATDRGTLVREVIHGEGAVAHGVVAPGSLWHHPGIPRRDFDRDRARALLEEAGWRERGGGVRADARGRRLRLDLLAAAGDEVKERTARAVARDWAAVGVDARVERLELPALLRERVYPRRYQAAVLTLVPSGDPAFLYGFYHSSMLTPRGWNRLAYRNAAVDRLLEKSQTALDTNERKALLDEAQELVAADVAQVCLFHPAVLDASSSRLVRPPSPRTAANRFMALHRWHVAEGG